MAGEPWKAYQPPQPDTPESGPWTSFQRPQSPTQAAPAPPAPVERSWGEAAKDTAVGVAQGGMNLGLGLGQLGNLASFGLLDKAVVRPLERGVNRALGGPGVDSGGIAGLSERVAETFDAQKSAALKQSSQELSETEGFLPSAKKVLTDPKLLGQFTAEQVPILATLGLGTAGTAARVGGKATQAAAARGASTKAAERYGRQAGRKAAVRQNIGATGAMGAGFAGNETVQDVLQQPDEVWAANPEFMERVGAGEDPQAVKEALALRAGQLAAAVAGPVSAATGALTAKLETDIFTGNLPAHGIAGLFSRPGARKVGEAIAKETAEEAIQEGSEQFGQNVGVQQVVDPARGLWEGVPEAAGTGAALGGVIGGGLGAGGVALSRPRGEPGVDPNAPQKQAPLLGLPAPGTVTVGPDGTAVTDAQGTTISAQEREAQAMAAQALAGTRAGLGLTPDVNTARRAHPGATPNLWDGSPLPDPAAGPLSRAVVEGVSAGAIPLAGDPSVIEGTATRIDPNAVDLMPDPEPAEHPAWIQSLVDQVMGGRRMPGVTELANGWGIEKDVARGLRKRALAEVERLSLEGVDDGQANAADAETGAVDGSREHGPADAGQGQAGPAIPADQDAGDGQAAAADTGDRDTTGGAADLARPPAGAAQTEEGLGPAVPDGTTAASAQSPDAPPATAPEGAAEAAPGPSAPGTGPAVPQGSVDQALDGAPASGEASAATGEGDVNPVQAAADAAATSPANDLPEPSAAQKEAGNYKVGRIKVAGLDVSVEYPAGVKRDPKHSKPLTRAYGRIRRTEGADGEHVDVFLGERAEDASLPVFVVDQYRADGTFDEHKVVMGEADEAAALEAYLSNYPKGWNGLGGIRQMTQEEFKAWVRDPQATKAPATGGTALAPPGSAVADVVVPPPRGAAVTRAELDSMGVGGSVPVNGKPWNKVQGGRWSDGEQIIDTDELLRRLDPTTDALEGEFTRVAPDAAAEPAGAEDVDLTAERKRLGVPRVIKKADAIKLLQREAVMSQLEAAAAWASIDRKGMIEGTRLGNDVLAFARAHKAKTEARRATIDAGFAANREAIQTLKLKKGDTVEWDANGKTHTGVIDSLGDKDQAVVVIGNSHVPASHLRRPAAEAAPAPEAEPDTTPGEQPHAPEVERRAAEAEAFAALSADGIEGKAAVEAWLDAQIKAADGTRKQALEAARETITGDLFIESLAVASGKKRAAAEKDEARDPEVYREALAAALAKAYPEANADEQQAFTEGWRHMLAGKTKSTMTGKGQKKARNAGYAAAKDWADTDAGSEFYEGKRGRKLENTGADLRRWFDKTMAGLKGASGEGWLRKLEKAGDRAKLFPTQAPAEGATPGLTRYRAALREGLPTGKQILENELYGVRRWRGDRAKSVRRTMLRSAEDPDKRDEAEDLIREYAETLRALDEFLAPFTTAKDARDAMAEIMPEPPEGTEPHPLRTALAKIMAYSDASLGKFWEGAEKAGYGNRKRANYEIDRALADENAAPEAGDRAKPLTRPKLDHVERDGFKDHRKGQDVTPQKVKETFGFADIGFGKWVSAKQDQDHLNYAFDAFMDLATTIGIDPRAIGLNGSLHLTIGALGHGRHAAHYSPNQPHPDGMSVPVINVTNTKGDGTVAHEWGHALDYHLRRSLSASYQSDTLREIVTELRSVPFDPEAVEKQFEGFFRGSSTMTRTRGSPVDHAYSFVSDYATTARGRRESTYQGAALRLDGTQSVTANSYWSNNEEMFARAWEAFIFDTMAEKGQSNTYLVNPWVADGAVTAANGYRGAPYPVGEERVRYNELMRALVGALKVEGAQVSVDTDKWRDTAPTAAKAVREFSKKWADLETMQAAFDAWAERQRAEQQAKRVEDEAARKVAAAEAEQRAAERVAALQAELEAQAVAGTEPEAETSELTEADYEALFDEVVAEAAERDQERPEAPLPGEPAMRDAPAAREPRAASQPAAEGEAPASKTAAHLTAEAAKLGVKGVGEAMAGLAELFGAGRIQSFPGGFDQEAYAKAKPHFEAALKAFTEAGRTLKELFHLLHTTFGAGVKPYLVQFALENKLQRQLGAPAQEAAHGQHPVEGRSQDDGGDSDAREGSASAQADEAGGDPAAVRGDVRGRDGGADDGGVAGAQDGRRPDRSGEGSPGSGDVGGRAGAGGNAVARGAAKRNHVVEPGGLTRQGGWQETAQRNADIITLAKALEREGRHATPAEQALLSQYTGFGASEIANKLFPTWAGSNGKNYEPAKLRANSEAWAAIGEQLRGSLTDEELSAIMRSTQYAHYTSETVTRAIWAGLQHMGFNGGAVFEPGMGHGAFPMTAPKDLAATLNYTGLEMDRLTSLVGRQLIQRGMVLNADYTKQKLPNDHFDLAIGNPPFASTVITADPAYRSHRFLLHDYFFAKTMDKLRPGGLLAFVTSAGTMNKGSEKARQYLSERADLVGAIRLPNTAFLHNAGTEVVTDIIVLRKRLPGEEPGGEAWLKLAPLQLRDGSGVSETLVNEYFVQHPEMVLGVQALTGTMYRANSYTVDPREGEDLGQALEAAFKRMPGDVYSPPVHKGPAMEQAAQERDLDPANRKEGGLYVSSAGVVMKTLSGAGQRLDATEKLSPKDVAWLKGAIDLRDKMKLALRDQRDNGNWEASLATLAKAYKAFVKKHGPLTSFSESERTVKDEDGNEVTQITRRYKNKRLLGMDVEGPLLWALEKETEDGSVVPSRTITHRAIAPPAPPKIETVNDALAVSLNDLGRLDLDHVAALAKVPVEQAKDQLGDRIYQDPLGGWVMSDEYLSGDVVTKLEEAEEAARTDGAFDRNVTALRKVQPRLLQPADIRVAPGMSWIPNEDVETFARDVLGINIEVTYNRASGQWETTATKAKYARAMGASSDWGHPDRSPAEILDSVLNNRQIKITRTHKEDGHTKTVTDQDATTAVNEIAKRMVERFGTWAWSDPDRAARLAKTYNTLRNRVVPRTFDGSHITPPGLSLAFKSLHPHQLRAIWRQIQTGDTYLAHAVGAGKTLEMIVGAMEQKRLGLISKPMFTVPNHMLGQFAAEFLEAYPAANIMVADEDSFTKEKRQQFVAAAAANAPDAIIISHSALRLLRVKEETSQHIVADLLAELDSAILSVDKSDRVARKKLEKQRESLAQRFEGKASNERQDDVVFFEDLGVDFLYVDEAHEFRKLDFVTNRGNVKGINPEGSAKALDLFIKIRHLHRQRPGRSKVLASGTPITNTMGELYTVQKFMDYDALTEAGLHHFDAWATEYGEVVGDFERNAAGQYQRVERFSKFSNLPELMLQVRERMDVLTSSQLGDLVKRPDVTGGKPQMVVAPASDALLDYMGTTLAERIEVSLKWKPTRDEPGNPDPMLAIITDARLAVIDMRFVDPTAKSDPGSKLNLMIDRIIQNWKEGKNTTFEGLAGKGDTQIVFSPVGFGASVAKRRGFDARAWVNKRLTEAGIPASEIAWMSDYGTRAKRQAMFKEMRAGTKRILIGSPANMGTGVNVQNRLRHLHFLSPPWFPSDVEQPHGRILRQGNLNPEIGLHWYVTEGTYDSTGWGMVTRKGRFIEQAMRGDASLRSAEDISEVSQYAMASALAAGDDRAIRVAELQGQIGRLTNLQRDHAHTTTLSRDRLQQANNVIEMRKRAIERLDEAIKLVDGDYLTADGFSITMANGKPLAGKDRAEIAPNLVKAILKTIPSKGEVTGSGRNRAEAEVGKLAGKYPVIVEAGDAGSQRGLLVRLYVDVGPYRAEVYDEAMFADELPADPASAVGMTTRMMNAVNRLGNVRDEYAADVKEIAREQAALQKRIKAPFPEERELFEKVAELANLQQEMLAESEKKGASKGGDQAAPAPAPDDAPRARRGKRTGSMTEAAVRGVVSKLRAGNARIRVVASYADLPARLRQEAEASGASANDLRAVFWRDQSWLVADMMADEAEVERVIFHEAFVHGGLRRRYGNRLEGEMARLAGKLGGREGVLKLAQEQGIDLRAYVRGMAQNARMTETQRLAMLAEELIAHVGESSGTLRAFIEEVIGLIRAFLRHHGLANFAELDVTDLRAEIRRARQAVLAPETAAPAAEPARASREGPAPVFYSALLEAVATGKGAPKRGNPTSWKGWLDGAQRRGEFRQAERDWLGLDAWLAARATTTREELADYVRAHQVRVQEVVLSKAAAGDAKARQNEAMEAVLRLEDAGFTIDVDDYFGATITDAEGEEVGPFSRLTPEQERDVALVREAAREDEPPGMPKFEAHQLPGGANYRELLLTLPMDSEGAGARVEFDSENDAEGFLVDMSAEGFEDLDYGAEDQDRRVVFFEQAIPAGVMPLIERNRGAIVQGQDTAGKAFVSSHFTQPNILAHVRFNERTDADGKRVLFLEEIQSDWHQAGRKRGYVDAAQLDRLASELKEAEAAYDNIYAEIKRENEDDARWQSLNDDLDFQAERIAGIKHELKGLGAVRVPDAPFKATDEWAMLAFKRMVRWAAENGFERIAWTTGAQQAERYDLGHHVESINVLPWDDGERTVQVSFKSRGRSTGFSTLYVDRAGTVTRAHGHSALDGATGKPLDEVLGKEVAEKVMAASSSQILAGDDLKIGGAGMRGFYDKIMPAAVNKWAKRFGGRVGQSSVLTKAPEQVAIVESNARREFGEGSPAYQQAMGNQRITVHALDLTPDMREAALGGLPLFRRAEAIATQAFKRWFGKSKVVDAAGEPRPVYHGTAEEFWAFDKGRLAGSTGHMTAPLGFFFEQDQGKARRYAENASEGVPADEVVMEVYLSIQNPKAMTVGQLRAVQTQEAARALRQRLERAGHDGIHLADIGQWIAFEPTQVKSATDNRGTFDPANPDIRFSLGNTATPPAAADQTETPAFRRWFGDSKVVDADGKPLVAYHGTNADEQFDEFTIFDDSFGAHFGTADQASRITAGRGGSPRTYAVYLSIQNPLRLTDPETRLWAKESVFNELSAKGITKDLEWADISDLQPDERGRAMMDAMIAAGYDGVVYENLSEGGGDSYIAFRPEQIKSATGNRGTFDPANPDIRFSLDNTAAPPTAADLQIPGQIRLTRSAFGSVKEWMEAIGKGKLTDWKPAMLATVPLNHLVDFAKKGMHAVHQYVDLQYQMQAMRNKLYVEYDAIAQDWLKFAATGTVGGWLGRGVNAQGAALADLMHDSTIAEVDPTEHEAEYALDAEKTRLHKELRARFDALPKMGQQLFVRARDAYTRQVRMLEDVLAENLQRAVEINRARAEREFARRMEEIERNPEFNETGRKNAQKEARAALSKAQDAADERAQAKIAALRQKFESLRVARPYFPLKRFGSYYVVVKKGPTMVGYSKFETAAQQQAFVKQMRERGFSTVAGLDTEQESMRQAIDPRFVAEIEEILAGADMPEFVKDEVWQAYLERLPDMSLRKSFIHREKVPGYHPDALRAFSSAMFHGSYQIARLKYGQEMGEALDIAEEQARRNAPVEGMQVVNELRKRHDFILNPKGGRTAQLVNSTAFTWYLGANPAHLFINASQTVMIGLPVLGSRYGFGRSAKALTRAMRDFAGGRGHIEAKLTGDERKAAQAFMDMGLWEKTQAHDLAGVGETGVEYSAVRNKVMNKIGWIFHQSERFNRETTSIAAYRLARSAGKSHAESVREAAKLTYTTHFDYSAAARPRWMQNDTMKMLMVFRNYNVNMLYRIFRDAHEAFRGESPQVRREARRQLGGIMGMYGLMAGTMGVPMYGLTMALAGVFEDDDEPFTAEQQFIAGTVELLGPDAARVLLRGIPGAVFDIDLSERIGLPNLWFRSPDRELEGRDAWYFWMEQLLGAAAGIPKNMFDGLGLIHKGEVQRGVERMLPSFLKSPMKAMRYVAEGGQATNLSGRPIAEMDAGNVFAQAMGYTPLTLAEQYEANAALKGAETKLSRRRRRLTDRYLLAAQLGDQRGMDEAITAIAAFNTTNPAFAITRDTLRKSQRMRERHDLMNRNGIVMNRRLELLRQARDGEE